MAIVAQDISLTEDAKRVIKIAQAIAKENMHPNFGAAHLLKALVHKDAGLHPLLKSLDKDIYYIEEWADVRIESERKSASPVNAVSGDASVEEVMNEADTIRLKFLKDHIEPLHL
ncbi:MAG: hypothetical protein QM802_03410 [Agriterribacter sp.]